MKNHPVQLAKDMGKLLGALIPVLALALVIGLVSGGNFNDEFDSTWEPQNSWTYDGGNSLSMALVSNSSGLLNHTLLLFLQKTSHAMIFR